MRLDLSPGAYLGYLIYVVYTGFYVCNRIRGKSAQFGINRVNPSDSTAMKIFADICVLLAFLVVTTAFI
jgi:hypothetical protein